MEPGEPTRRSPRDKGVLFIGQGQAPGNPGIRLGSPGLRCRVWGARAAAAIGPPGPQPRLGPATSPQEAELGPKQLRLCGHGMVCAPRWGGEGGLLTVSASRWDSHVPEESSEPHRVPEGTGEERDLRPVTPPPAWSAQSCTDPVEGHTVTTRRPRSSLRSRVPTKDTKSSCLWYVISGGLRAKGSAAHTRQGTHTTFWSLLKQISIMLNYSGGFPSGRQLRELISICANKTQI